METESVSEVTGSHDMEAIESCQEMHRHHMDVGLPALYRKMFLRNEQLCST